MSKPELTCTMTTSEAEPVLRKYINKHGKEAVMNVSRIGSTQKKTRRELTADELGLLSGASNPSVYVLGVGERYTELANANRKPIATLASVTPAQ